MGECATHPSAPDRRGEKVWRKRSARPCLELLGRQAAIDLGTRARACRWCSRTCIHVPGSPGWLKARAMAADASPLRRSTSWRPAQHPPLRPAGAPRGASTWDPSRTPRGWPARSCQSCLLPPPAAVGVRPRGGWRACVPAAAWAWDSLRAKRRRTFAFGSEVAVATFFGRAFPVGSCPLGPGSAQLDSLWGQVGSGSRFKIGSTSRGRRGRQRGFVCHG